MLETPNKSALGAYTTPDRLRLREPHSEHVLFSQKPQSAVPAHLRETTWEPRTPTSITTDFSSGGETPNTPAEDSDVSTPGTHLINKMGRLNTEEVRTKSPKKSRRESFMQKIFKGSPSPSKEKEKEKDSRRGYSNKAENRVLKRRSKSRKVAAQDGYDSDGTQVGAPSTRPKGVPEDGYIKQAGNFFHWVEAHPHLPSVMTTWLQFAVNTIILCTGAYICYTIWQGVQADVNITISEHEAATLRENMMCARDYEDHNCDKPTAYVMELCNKWSACMSRDAKAVAKASVTARTFARIFNTFVQEFSTKAMVCIAFFLFMFWYFALQIFKARFQKPSPAFYQQVNNLYGSQEGAQHFPDTYAQDKQPQPGNLQAPHQQYLPASTTPHPPRASLPAPGFVTELE